MKNYGSITHPNGVPTKEYVDNAVANAGGTSGGGDWETLCDYELTEGGTAIAMAKINGNITEYSAFTFYAEMVFPALETQTNCGLQIKIANETASAYNCSMGYKTLSLKNSDQS